jgi:hypothetical protein
LGLLRPRRHRAEAAGSRRLERCPRGGLALGTGRGLVLLLVAGLVVTFAGLARKIWKKLTILYSMSPGA